MSRFKFDLQRFALNNLTQEDGVYLIQSADDVSTFKALDASARAGQTFRITANLDVSSLFTLTGVKTTEGLTIKDGVVTLKADNLNNANVTLTNGDYTLAMADDVPHPENVGETTTMSGTDFTISAGGVYQFADGFTADDYKALVAKMFNGEITVSNDITAEPAVTAVTVDYQGNIK